MTRSPPTILVVMGVSGAGKTTVGARLGDRLGWAFMEGDDLHPPASVAKMRSGAPLTDSDRAPWLEAIARWIDGCRAAGVSGVVTCSTLKRAYRRALARDRPEVRFVYLECDAALLSRRLMNRRGHFMPPSLLASQLNDLEPPTAEEAAIVVDASRPVEAQVDWIVQSLGGPSRST